MTRARSEGNSEPTPDATAYLQISGPDIAVSKVPLTRQQVSLGRSPEASVRLSSRAVSRHHAELTRDPFGRWFLRDLGSHNGTQVNGEPVQERVLAPGDTIRVGPFFLKLLVRDALDEPTPMGVAEGSDTPTNPFDVEDLRSLDDASATKLESRHVVALTHLAQQLTHIDDVRERLHQLCRFMVGEDFRGEVAVALRVAPSDGEPNPQFLCETASNDERSQLYLSRSLLRSVQQSGTPALATNISDGHGGERVHVSLPPERRPMSAVASPLRTAEDYMDLLYVVFPVEYGTAEWLALVTLVAQTYQQVETEVAARRQAEAHAAVERELARARELQMRMSTETPAVPGLEIAIGFDPCRWVAGDYVDVIRTRDEQAGLLIADVVGKGLGAALISAEVHAIVHASLAAGASVVELMQTLNDYFVEHLDMSSFITMVAVVTNPADGEIQIVNAGHPPPYAIQPDGSPRRLTEADCMPLGITPQTFEPRADKLRDGELLALYTDGLTELQQPSGSRVGIEGLGEQIATMYESMRDQPLDTLAGRLTERLRELEDEAMPQDDRTFILCRRSADG